MIPTEESVGAKRRLFFTSILFVPAPIPPLGAPVWCASHTERRPPAPGGRLLISCNLALRHETDCRAKSLAISVRCPFKPWQAVLRCCTRARAGVPPGYGEL